MELVRDIVVIVFAVTGTVTSVVILFMALKLYGPAIGALGRIGRAADDIHGAADMARTGVRAAKGTVEVVAPVLLGPGVPRLVSRVPGALRLANRLIRFRSSED